MKRLITLTICLLSLQLANAKPGVVAVPPSTQQKIDSAHAASPLQYTGYAGMMKQRLDLIKKDVPLDYNEYVQSYIDIYTSRRDEMGRVLGLSKYYFPIYEKAFHEAGIPEEIEYLSIVESALNPNATSRVGAAGPWQFMATTGKIYGLAMDDYIDERRDPVLASKAAAAYLKDAYQELGDWLLAIASYNCGKSSVESAIQQAGANNFWAIRSYLPPETRGYVPAYIATAYVMNYYKKHNIMPQSCNLPMQNDTVLVDKSISLNSVASNLNIDLNQLSLLNPSYKRMIINGTVANPRRMILPRTRAQFAAVYHSLNSSLAPVVIVPVQPVVVAAKVTDNSIAATTKEQQPAFHTVKKGETIDDIAGKYSIRADDLKNWNHLSLGSKIPLQPGLTLKISHG